MNEQDKAAFGPLAQLLGVWEGNKGVDVSPGHPNRQNTDTEKSYLEKWVFEPILPHVENHEQKLRQIVADTNAWRGTPSTADKVAGEPFHAQRGYWVWDRKTGMVINSFAVPRGIAINAGGQVEPDANSFTLVAEAGSETYGIAQNPFLIDKFKVIRYTLKVTVNDDNSIDYWQNTELDIDGRGHFDHTDENHLLRQ